MNKTNLAIFTLLTTILATVITIGITPAAFATPTINTATGNYYEYISDPDITWTEAKAAAESRTYNGVSGYLVTITTASENTFVDNLVPDGSHSWIGLSDETTEGIYAWVTGEWYGTYSNWTTTPAGSLQDYAEFIEATGKWNDTTNNDTNIDGYTVEYAPPPTQNTANGNYYSLVTAPDITWTDAKAAAENSTYNGASGHLVTITSSSENTFVNNLVPNDSHLWIGLSDETTEGTYEWVTSEPFLYSNWNTGQPSAGTDKDYIEFLGSNGKWNDAINRSFSSSITGYIIEYAPPVKNPANGHYYEFIYNSDITWTDAKTAAENSTYKGLSGHLVTITSSSENTFVDGLVPDNSHSWMGLFDKHMEGTYEWVTSEPFLYSNWNTGQPSAGTDEDYIEFLGSNGKWNDNVNRSNTIDGYVIEYDVPLLNRENGHYYQYVINNDITWTDAKTAAENSTYNDLSGYLVTITSSSENTFVKGLVPDDSDSWIGLSDETTEGDYRWVTGEPYSYSNWASGQPNNSMAAEHYVDITGVNGEWFDAKNNVGYITGYIIEYAPPVKNPANGHYYEYVADDDITWTDAKTAAESRTYNGVSGYLVTITTASENTFVDNLVPDGSHSWIGLSDEDVKWAYAWVTGESFIYTNWSPGQPVNPNGNEDYVEFTEIDGNWNNIVNDSNTIDGYVIEYGSNPVLNTQNRHYYQYVIDDDITWTAAKTAAENSTYNGVAGHLVTITSANENTFVDNLVPDNSHSWIGLSDETTEGQYKWITDDLYDYTNWNTTQPSAGTDEDYVEFLGSNGKWNDTTNNATGVTGYIIEYILPTTDPTLNTVNGHYYEYVADAGITWTDAKTAAENSTHNGRDGHLVTITSQSENDFVAGLHQPDFRPWIGLTDKDIEGQYKWVTDEPYSYSNWSPNQPDNHNDNEDYVQFLGYNDKWNDLPNDYNIITGYIIEYAPPVKNPVNGHYYEYIISYDISWTDAKTAAENSTHNGTSGHLVTITSQSENDFVAELVPDNSRTWMGLTDKTTEGTYKWVTDEPFSYTNWDVNQPDNYNDNEDYVQFRGYDDKWNDIKNDPGYINGYIVEYTPPPVKNSGNGHYYEYIGYPGITWTDAKTAAENSTYNGVAGHLVTITSASENAFVADLVPNDARTWIGFSDEDVNHSYRWVTGELYIYTNWDTNQPSSNTNSDDYVEFSSSNGKWNDTTNNDTNLTGYVIEYDFPLLNPANGHYYEFIYNSDITWTDAKTAAETHTYNGVAGHLVTITSASENDFIKGLFDVPSNLWIGLTDKDTEGTYKWVTGEPFNYSSWGAFQPHNFSMNQDFTVSTQRGLWHVVTDTSLGNAGYIVEYDTPNT